MRVSLTFLSLVLASGSLVAADSPDTYNWFQVQGGITGHSSQDSRKDEPAYGVGLGTWVNSHVGFEASALGTHVDYGYAKARETQAYGSILLNPFATPSNVRPFLRLGLGADKVGSPFSGTGSDTTRLSGVAGVGLQFLLGNCGLFTLEGRLVQIDTNATRKEGQALAGIGVRWGHPPTIAAVAPPPPPPVEPPPPPPPVILEPAPPPAPQEVYVPPAVVPRTVVLDEATLHFSNGKAILSPEGREAVNKVASELKEVNGTYQLVVRGHTSKVGTAAFNLKLSRNRAEVVAKALEEAGVPAADITSEGMGFSQPLVKEMTKADQAKNRRVEIEIKTKAANVETQKEETPLVE